MLITKIVTSEPELIKHLEVSRGVGHLGVPPAVSIGVASKCSRMVLF